ncbi:MAG: type II secretion system F family protein, partial [Blastocatellia bacterium]|nr:type II secretion system F family protein [Blastocatellia bacterium]
YVKGLFDRVVIEIPFLGKNLKKLALSRFSRSLATLYAGGVEMHKALKLSIETMGNSYLQQRSRIVQVALSEGETLTRSMAATVVFPVNLVEMVAVGEQTGELDKMLHKAADYYEFEADKAIKALLAAIPIGIYLLVAIYIAFTVISFYAGYFRAIGNIAQ